MKNIVLILGNGFTIDFLRHIECKDVAVVNLFKQGEDVPWPGNDMPGFLSYKHCPNLWTLGARSTLEQSDSIEIIENIITCANVIQNKASIASSVYIKAYKELEHYFMALFIYYNTKIDVESDGIKHKLINWGWLKYIEKIYNDTNINKIHIITLNYDIWLERILKYHNLKFDIVGFDNNDAKIQIYKPHGSISFQTKDKKDQTSYQISKDISNKEDGLDKLELIYKDIQPYSFFNAIIPPAGDSARYKCKWAKSISDHIMSTVKKLTANDDLIISGVSYWHVDRLELDSILTEISSNISNVIQVNPNPSKSFDAVLTTLFENSINYSHCNNLHKI